MKDVKILGWFKVVFSYDKNIDTREKETALLNELKTTYPNIFKDANFSSGSNLLELPLHRGDAEPELTNMKKDLASIADKNEASIIEGIVVINDGEKTVKF